MRCYGRWGVVTTITKTYFVNAGNFCKKIRMSFTKNQVCLNETKLKKNENDLRGT